MPVMRYVRNTLVILALMIVGFILVKYYSYIFAKKVRGEIVDVARVTDPGALIGGRLTADQLHSFAIAIRDEEGRIFTASSEDRQWAVAKKGFCVVAKFYPYPPWEFDAAGTYFNARLMELRDCKGLTQENSTEPLLNEPAPEAINHIEDTPN